MELMCANRFERMNAHLAVLFGSDSNQFGISSKANIHIRKFSFFFTHSRIKCLTEADSYKDYMKELEDFQPKCPVEITQGLISKKLNSFLSEYGRNKIN